MVTNFVSIKSVVEDYKAYTGNEDPINTDNILRWADDVAIKFQVDDALVHKVSLVDISNYTGKLPKGFKKMVQVGYTDNPRAKYTKHQLYEWVEKSLDETGCSVHATLECPECEKTEGNSEVIIDLDRISDLTHPEFRYSYMKHFTAYGGRMDGSYPFHLYSSKFKLIRPAQHNFFGVDQHVKMCVNLNSQLLADCPHEYKLEDRKRIRTSFAQGQLLMAYLAVRTDEDGYHYIPDIPEAFQAINEYIESRITYQEFRRTGERKWYVLHEKAQQMANRYIGRTKELLNTPEFASWMTFIDNHWRKHIRDVDSQRGFNRYTPDPYSPPRI